MPLNIQEVFRFLTTLAKEENLKICINRSLYSGIVIGAAGIIGGLLCGNKGMALGSSFAGVVSSLVMKDSFKPVVTVLLEMSDSDKARLAESFTKVLYGLDINDYAKLTTVIVGNVAVRQQILQEFLHHLRTELNCVEVA